MNDETIDDERKERVLSILRSAARVELRLDRELSNVRGIGFTDYRVLRELAGRDAAAATRADLAAAVRMTPSAITRSLKPLEKIGCVRTADDASDPRRRVVSLTEAGAELLRDAEGVVRDGIAALSAAGASSGDDRLLELVGRPGTN